MPSSQSARKHLPPVRQPTGSCSNRGITTGENMAESVRETAPGRDGTTATSFLISARVSRIFAPDPGGTRHEGGNQTGRTPADENKQRRLVVLRRQHFIQQLFGSGSPVS